MMTGTQAQPATDAEVSAMIDEAMDPALSQDWLLLGDEAAALALAKVTAARKTAEIEKDEAGAAVLLAEEAKLAARFRRVQVRILNLRASREIAKVLAPHLGILDGMGEGNGLGRLGDAVAAAADALPRILELAFGSQGVTADWLDEHATPDQAIAAVAAVWGKMGLADALGGLLRPGGRAG